MQQSGYDEMQLLQQQLMLKQLQDLQRQQQLQQQNYLNPLSTFHRQAPGSQFPPLVDGMPLSDASQGYINWVERGASPAQHGTLNKDMFSMGVGSQQLDASLYGTPISNARGSMVQQPPFQVMYQNSGNLGAKIGGQTLKSGMQASEFSNPFLKDQYSLSPVLPQGAFVPNQFQGKNMLGMGLVHGLSNGIVSSNLQRGIPQQIHTPSRDFNGRQEQVNWSLVQQKDTKSSQVQVPLDPLEEKILFNMEDSSLSEIASGVFGNTFDNVDISTSFPSVQSGSWSALMQSAVAEASSSDTGIQEEFSGLTFQNMELSADNNYISTFIDSDKQQTSWVNSNSLPGSMSFSSKMLPVVNNSDVNSGIPRFQSLSLQQREGSYQDSPGSVQGSSKVTAQWVYHSPQQKLSVEGNQRVQPGLNFDDSGGGKIHLPPTGMLDQVQSQTGNLQTGANDLPANSLPGMSNSFQSLTSSLDLSHGQKWENASDSLGKAGMFPHFKQQNNDLVTVPASDALDRKNEPQTQMVANPPAALQSDKAMLPDANLEADLESKVSVQSSFSHRDITQQFNVWMDLPPRKHPLCQESHQFPLSTSSSVDLLTNNFINVQKAQHSSSEAYNMPQRVGLLQDQRASTECISSATTSNKDFPSVSLIKKPDITFSQSHSSVHQSHVVNNSETGLNIQRVGSATVVQKFYEQNSGIKMPMDSGMNSSTSQPSSFAFGDMKMLNLMMDVRKNQNVTALPENLLSDARSSGMVALGQFQSESQPSGSNVITSNMEHGHINLHHATTPVWFKQFETFRNGQMQPADVSKMIPDSHLSSEKSPQHLRTCVEQDHVAQDARPSGTIDQKAAIITSKKRKLVIPARLAWHEEVSNLSRRQQTISMAEQEWAQVSNHLVEKGEYEIETVDFVHLLPRSKRRLIRTTQIMQQLICPAPKFVLLGEATSNFDSLLYSVTRATLGDACSLTNCQENALPSSLCDDNLMPENITFERSYCWKYSEAAKELMEKMRKLDSDLERLEKGASMGDIRFEIQDLERFAVINRFARFHSRAQVDNSGNPLRATLPKPIPQRYVTALPLPRNLPEGVQCLSL